MKRIILLLAFALMSIALFGQAEVKTNFKITKTTPTLFFNGTGGIIDFNSSDITLTNSTNKLTLAGGNIDLLSNSILGTGSLGSTGAGKFAKGWFTDLEITNLPTINGGTLASALSLSTYLLKTDTTAMMLPYIRQAEVASSLLGKVGVADTASMLTPYVNRADTATMLTKYARKASPTFTGTVGLPSTTSIGNVSATEIGYLDNVTSAIQTQFTGKVGTGDTATMLTPYINRADTATMLSKYETDLNVAKKLAKSDTASMLTPYINRADTASMLSHYIERKDTSSMLTPYINRSDTSAMLSNYIDETALNDLTEDVSTANLTHYDYIIEKGSSTYYARGTGVYADYSGVSAHTVLQSAIDALTEGGIIGVKYAIYTDIDSIRFLNDNITIEGIGRMPIFKLINSFDADRSESFSTGMFNLLDADHITFRNIELDGNQANQTKIDDNNAGNGMYGFVRGINGLNNADTDMSPDSIIIENCYIHDFSCDGISIYNGNYMIVRNSTVKNNASNQIGIGRKTTKALIENCIVGGGADVAIGSAGIDVDIINCTVLDMDGTHGTTGSFWGIGFEGSGSDKPTRNRVVNCNISGSHIQRGIRLENESLDMYINGNSIFDLSTTTYAVGIFVNNSDYSTVINNKIFRIKGSAIALSESNYCSFINNDLTQNTDDKGINITSNSTYNKFIGNNVFSVTGIEIASGCNYNIITGNILQGYAANFDLIDNAVGTILNNNYGLAGTQWLNKTGLENNAYTATSGGLTTGIIKDGSQNITVTSSNAAYICTLPAASSTTIGTKITGTVGSNGFELRVQAAQATTVYLNGVTTNVEAAIPANTYFEVLCIDATHWVLNAWSTDGTIIARIVPDAV